jgi:hypothetical protein
MIYLPCLATINLPFWSFCAISNFSRSILNKVGRLIIFSIRTCEGSQMKWRINCFLSAELVWKYLSDLKVLHLLRDLCFGHCPSTLPSRWKLIAWGKEFLLSSKFFTYWSFANTFHSHECSYECHLCWRVTWIAFSEAVKFNLPSRRQSMSL